MIKQFLTRTTNNRTLTCCNKRLRYYSTSSTSNESSSDEMRIVLDKVLEQLHTPETQLQFKEIAKLDFEKETLLKWISMHDQLQQIFLQRIPSLYVSRAKEEFGSAVADKIAVSMFRNEVGKEAQKNSEFTRMVNEINAIASEECFPGVAVNRIERPKLQDSNIEKQQIFTDEFLRQTYIKVLDIVQSEDYQEQIKHATKNAPKDNQDLLISVRPVIFKAQLQALESQVTISDLKQLIEIWVNFRCALDEWIPRVCNLDTELDQITKDHHSKLIELISPQPKKNRNLILGILLFSIILSVGLFTLNYAQATKEEREQQKKNKEAQQQQEESNKDL